MKFIESPAPELYDLSADPAERQNLAGSRGSELGGISKELWSGMQRFAAGADTSRSATGASTLDAEALARLESLGYVGGGGGARSGPDVLLPPIGGRNPRDGMDEVNQLSDAQIQIAAGHALAVIPTLEALRKSDPGNPQVLLKLGHALADVGRDDEAVSSYSELIQTHPAFHAGYRAYGEFLLKRGRGAEAKEVWMKALRALPGYTGVEVQIARAELSAKTPSDAAARLEAYLRTRPDDVEGWGLMGRAQAALGDKTKALDAYRRALAIYPTDSTALEGAVTLLVSSNRRPEAVELINQLLARKPGDPILTRASQWLAGDIHSRPKVGGVARAPGAGADSPGH
jgi:cytochrome c-type biogenesis protein CcmH/NrfG